MGKRGPHPSGHALSGAERQRAYEIRKQRLRTPVEKPVFVARTIMVRDFHIRALEDLRTEQGLRSWSEALRVVIDAGLKAIKEQDT